MKQPFLLIPFAAFKWFISAGLINVMIGMTVDSVMERVDRMKCEKAEFACWGNIR